MKKGTIDALSPEYQDLCKQAKEACTKGRGYVSKFLVGASILTVSGETFTDSNNESADLTLTHHAEMCAIDIAVHNGYTKFSAIAVYSSTMELPVTPCGLCRQKIREYGDNILIIMLGKNGEVWQATIDELLPYAFTADDVGFEK